MGSSKKKTPVPLTGSDSTLEGGAVAGRGPARDFHHPGGVVNSRGGRRSVAEEQGLIEALRNNPLPPIGATPLDVLSFVDAVAKRVSDGVLDRGRAEVLGGLARTALAALKAHKDENELRELEAMLQEMRDLDAAAEGRAQDVQQGRRPSR